jgi:hypothetical protein
MEISAAYTYRSILPSSAITGNRLRYCIVVFRDGKPQTFPAAVTGSPLDWDFTENTCWETAVISPDDPVLLFSVTGEHSGMDTFTMPEWSRTRHQLNSPSPLEKSTLQYVFQSDEEHPVFFLRKYIRDEIRGREERLRSCKSLCIQLKQAPSGLFAGFITTDGFAYNTACPAAQDGVVRLPLTAMKQGKTALLPHAYPVFLDRYFQPDTTIPFRTEAIESVELWFGGQQQEKETIEIGSIWLE